ncbi:MAG: hypothetical protein EOO61_23235, partial [Hymenobacter sp.]
MPKRPGDAWALDKRVRDFIGTLILLNELSLVYIATIARVSPRTVRRIKRYLIDFRVPYNPIVVRRGRPQTITPEITTHLRLYLYEKPTAYLDEVTWWLNDVFDIQIHICTLSRHLHSIGWSRKVARKTAAERNEVQRSWFQRTVMQQYTPEELVFIDESAAQERTGDRRYGWSPIRETPIQLIPFHRSPRWSILPALTSTGYLHPLIYHGSINADRFAAWLEEMILPF